MNIYKAIIILGISWYMGIRCSNRCMKRYKEMCEVKNIILMIRNEIRYKHSTLSETFISICNRMKEGYKEQILEMAEFIEERSKEENIAGMWEKTMMKKIKKDGFLRKSDIEKIGGFGRILNEADRKTQTDAIDMFIKEMEYDINEQKKELKNNVRLCKSLGILGGVTVVILLF